MHYPICIPTDGNDIQLYRPKKMPNNFINTLTTEFCMR